MNIAGEFDIMSASKSHPSGTCLSKVFSIGNGILARCYPKLPQTSIASTLYSSIHVMYASLIRPDTHHTCSSLSPSLPLPLPASSHLPTNTLASSWPPLNHPTYNSEDSAG
eukprot:761719-Hanusia_phi.AAC.1